MQSGACNLLHEHRISQYIQQISMQAGHSGVWATQPPDAQAEWTVAQGLMPTLSMLEVRMPGFDELLGLTMQTGQHRLQQGAACSLGQVSMATWSMLGMPKSVHSF